MQPAELVSDMEHLEPFTSPFAFFFDDNPETVEKHAVWARNRNLRTIVSKSLTEAWHFLNQFGSRGLFFIDQHIEGVNHLGSIGFPDTKTNRGATVGTGLLAAANRERCRINSGNVGIMSAVDPEPNALNAIDVLEQLGTKVFYLKKEAVSEDEFSRIIDDYLETLGYQPSLVSRFAVLSKGFRRAGFSASTLAAALGFTTRDASFERLDSYFDAVHTIASTDLDSRLDLTLSVYGDLVRLSDDDPKIMNKWLNTPSPFLDEIPPRDMIEDGKILSLLRVMNLLREIG